MKNMLQAITISAAFLIVSNLTIAQSVLTPQLAGYTFFTSVGAFTNIGSTNIKGNIGTNAGSLTGFPGYGPPSDGNVTGTINVGNTETANRANEAQSAYTALITRTPDFTIASPTLGNGQSLTPGTYSLGEAGTIDGNLTLTGGAADIFVFQIDGALAAGVASKIILSGVTYNNVYWNVTGEVTLGEGSDFQGNIVSAGAINLLSGTMLTGRGITIEGAISLNDNEASNVASPLPVTLSAFNVKKGEYNTAQLSWTTTSETKSGYFEVQRSQNGKVWGSLAQVTSKGESTNMEQYSFSDISPDHGINMYRLKMVDLDASFAYSTMKSIEFESAVKTIIYPNPTIDRLTLDVEDINNIQRVQLNDILGRSIYNQARTKTTGLSSTVDTSNLTAGLYLVHITRFNGTVATVRILKN